MFSFVGWNLLRGKKLIIKSNLDISNFLTLKKLFFVNKKRDSNNNLLVYSNNQSYFQYFEDSIWDLYISITTANFPDVM